MTRPRIIFSDFDGSIAYTEVDQIPRRLLPHAVEVLAWIREQGNYLVLWTCRTGTRLAVALRFLHEQGIVFDAINENWPGAFPTSRKAFADFYIDDHSFPIDWLKIKTHIAAMPAPEDFTPALNQDALPPLIKHRLAVHANRLKRKPGKAPRWMYPLTVEVYYRKILLAFIAKLQAEVETKILPKVKGMLAEVGALKQDAWSADLDTLMGDFQDSFDSIFPQPKMLEALESVTYKTNTFNAAQWYKICNAAIGIQLYGKEPLLTGRMEAFLHDNVTLINDVEAQVYKDVRLTVSQGVRNGDRYNTIANDILADTDLTRGVFGKVKTRARLIARDQVNKLNGDIAQYRQQGVGVDEYWWRGVGDERERDSHVEMNDSLCRWDDPNVYSLDDGATWIERPEEMMGLIPGQDYNCRCYAEPKFSDDFLSESGADF